MELILIIVGIIILYYIINYFIYGNSCGCQIDSIMEKFIDLGTFMKLIKEKDNSNPNSYGRFELPINTRDSKFTDSSNNNFLDYSNNKFRDSSNNKFRDSSNNKFRDSSNNKINQEGPFSEQALAIRRKKYDVKDESVFNNLSLLKLDNEDLPLSERNIEGDDKYGILNDVYTPLEEIDQNGRLEITNLKQCTVPMKLEFENNTNNIINTGDLINYDILTPESNKAMIFNQRYNLMKISWARSMLNWNGARIPLDIRFTFVSSTDGKAVNIIFPLIFTESANIEKFEDTYFENDTDFKTTFDPDADKISQSMKDGLIHKPVVIKNVIFDENVNKNTMINEIDNSNKSIIGQMTFGVMKSFFGKYFTNNAVLDNQVRKTSYLNPTNVMNQLSELNFDKLDLTTVPKNTDLNELNKIINNNNFNKMTEQIPSVKYTLFEASTLLNLDSLVTDSSIIPDYVCCNPNITSSKLITIDLTESIQEKILNQQLFYKATSLDGNLVLITQPYPYDKKTGKDIYNKLSTTNKLF